MSFSFTKTDHFGGLPDSLRQIVPQIIQNRIKEYEDHKKYFEASDFVEICKYCHKVEGVAVSYGLYKLDEVIRHIHKLAKAEDIAQINQTLLQLELYFQQIQTLSI